VVEHVHRDTAILEFKDRRFVLEVAGILVVVRWIDLRKFEVMSKKDIETKENEIPKGEFLFENVNYKLLLIGLGAIALGFILMAGGGSDDPKVWNDAVFDFRRIRLAPTVVLIGFGITIWSILKNPKQDLKNPKQ